MIKYKLISIVTMVFLFYGCASSNLNEMEKNGIIIKTLFIPWKKPYQIGQVKIYKDQNGDIYAQVFIADSFKTQYYGWQGKKSKIYSLTKPEVLDELKSFHTYKMQVINPNRAFGEDTELYIHISPYYIRATKKHGEGVYFQISKEKIYDEAMKKYITDEQMKEEKNKRKQKKKNIAYNYMGRYMINECKYPTWKGSYNQNDEPIGKGCFICADYFGTFAHNYYRVCGVIENGRINTGTVYANISDGTIMGYRTSVYKETFDNPNQIKNLMIKLNKKATQEWNRHIYEEKNNISPSSDNTTSYTFEYEGYTEWNKHYVYNLKYDGSYDGQIFYYDDNGQKTIMTIGVKHGQSVNGYYSSGTLYTVQCGKTDASSITDAIRKAVKCVYESRY